MEGQDAHYCQDPPFKNIQHTGFPIKDARLLKYLKSIFHIIIPSLSSLSRQEYF